MTLGKSQQRDANEDAKPYVPAIAPECLEFRDVEQGWWLTGVADYLPQSKI